MPRALPRLMIIVLIAVVLCGLQRSVTAQTKECPLTPDKYAKAGYKVREIQIDTPLQIFGQVKGKVADIKADLAQSGKYANPEARAHPVKEKEVLNVASLTNGAEIVRNRFASDLQSAGRVEVTLVLAHLSACKERDTSLGNPQGDPTLVVEYKVYTTNYSSYLSSVYEGQGQGLSRATLPTPLTKFLAAHSPHPYLGFNRSRALFGGARVVSKTSSPLFQQITTEASGSSSSVLGVFNVQGAKDSDSGALSHLEWVAGYRYHDTPAAPLNLKEGRAFGQIIGASQPLGKLKTVLRFGGSVEGGNQQSDLSPLLVPRGILSSTGYSSLKLFAGGTFRKGGQDFTASYGVEIGSSGSGRHIDYVKNLFDLGYSGRFLPRLHRPLTMEARFSAGVLDSRGPVPLGTRFFGGNAEKNFISSDNWMIREAPFIRSFAENQFVPAGKVAAIGADRFYSLNLTFAPTVWGRPLVPRGVIDSPGFDQSVNGAFNNVENFTFAADLGDTPAVKALAERLADLDRATSGQLSPLNIIKENLAPFESQFAADEDAVETVSDVAPDIEDLQSKLAALESEVTKRGRVIFQLQMVAKDFSSCTDSADDTIPSVSSSLHVLAVDLDGLMELLDEKGVPQADEHRQKLAAQKQLVDSLYQTAPCEYALLVAQDVTCTCQGNVDEQTKQALIKARANAQQRAKDSIAPAREIFGRLTKELNLFALSPLFIFDVARPRSRIPTATTGTTRYGVGGGVRFSIVSLDLDMGYALNVRRQTPERRGAFVFSMRINDLLR